MCILGQAQQFELAADFLSHYFETVVKTAPKLSVSEYNLQQPNDSSSNSSSRNAENGRNIAYSTGFMHQSRKVRQYPSIAVGPSINSNQHHQRVLLSELTVKVITACLESDCTLGYNIAYKVAGLLLGTS